MPWSRQQASTTAGSSVWKAVCQLDPKRLLTFRAYM
jgi:hypothetical protein